MSLVAKETPRGERGRINLSNLGVMDSERSTPHMLNQLMGEGNEGERKIVKEMDLEHSIFVLHGKRWIGREKGQTNDYIPRS